MSAWLMVNTDDDFVIQIGDKVIHSYTGMYYEDPKLLAQHLRDAKILSVTPWSIANKVVASTDVHHADYFLTYCKQAADALVENKNFKIGGNQTLHLILVEDNVDYYAD